MTVAFTVVLLASFRLITWEPAVLTAETGKKAVATGLMVICLVTSMADPPEVATTVVGNVLVRDAKTEGEVEEDSREETTLGDELIPFFKTSGSNSGRTLVTVLLICPEDVLIVLMRTLGMTGIDPAGDAGDSLLLLSLVTLQGLSGCFESTFLPSSRADSCSGDLSVTFGISLASLGEFCGVALDSGDIASVLDFFALSAAIAAMQDEIFADDLALAWERLVTFNSTTGSPSSFASWHLSLESSSVFLGF